MSATLGSPQQERQQRQQEREESPTQEIKQKVEKDVGQVKEKAQKAQKRFAPLIAFWTKINNDWIFNWSAALAYTFLTSLFPLFLVILAIGGFILGAISPESFTRLQNVLAGGFPGGASGTGGQIVKAVLHQLNRSAGVFLIVGIIGAIIAGYGLFLSLESAFGIAFRVRGRDPIPQRIMAVSMVLLYVILVPIMVFASILPSAVLGVLHIGTNNPGGAFLIQVLGLLVAFASACLFFGAIYFIVPNRRMSFAGIWKGTLLAAALLILYELAFPIYEGLFLHPSNYGSLVGFVIVILTFMYYLAFIVLLGAEVNSMAVGLNPTTKSLSALLEELQTRDLMIEPEAVVNGQETPQQAQKAEEAQENKAGSNREAVHQAAGSQQRAASGKSALPVAAAVATPREPVTAEAPAPATSPSTAPVTTQPAQHPPARPLTKRQRQALGAVVVAGVVAVAPVIGIAKRFMLGDDTERRMASD